MKALSDVKKIRTYLAKTVRSYLAGVAFECPFGGGNPKECICHELREKPEKERSRMLAALTDEECFQIFDGHQKCFREKSRLLDFKERKSAPRRKIRKRAEA